MSWIWFAYSETLAARAARHLALVVIGTFGVGALYAGLLWYAGVLGAIDVYAAGLTQDLLRMLSIELFVVWVALVIGRAYVDRLAERELLEQTVGEDLLEETLDHALETYERSEAV